MKTLIALFAAAAAMTAVADDQTTTGDREMTQQSREGAWGQGETQRETRGQGKSAEAKFSALDRDQDERLSKTEARQEDGLSDQFASLDQDSDGYLSKEEYESKSDMGSGRDY